MNPLDSVSRIGWCHTSPDSSVIFEPPSRFLPAKDTSRDGKSHFSCPAVRAISEGYFVIKSPFSLQLRFRKVGEEIHVVPIFPFTSLSERLLRDLLVLEPVDTWRSLRFPILQLPSPYLFLADTPMYIEQVHPFLSESSCFNWRLIPGKFDIYAWQRPLNWAVEWDIDGGDLVIRTGEPLYFVRFCREDNAVLKAPDLVHMKYTEDVAERVRMAAGVTGFRRGLNGVMKKAATTRGKPLVCPRD